MTTLVIFASTYLVLAIGRLPGLRRGQLLLVER
jgi:hypothetical protein